LPLPIGPNKFLNLENYFQLEGFAYRLVPIRNDQGGDDRINFGRVASDIMYNNLFNNFKWGNMNNPKVYIDENNSRMMTNIRNNFNRLAGTLVEEGKKEQAITVLEKGFELIPPSVVDYEYFSLEMVNTFYKTGAKEKASKIAEAAYKSFNEMLAYLVSLPPDYRASGDVNEEIQRAMFYMQKLGSTCNSYGDTLLAEKSQKTLQEYMGRYQGK
jgi:tetratricopeptide (TPR) repeat protein